MAGAGSSFPRRRQGAANLPSSPFRAEREGPSARRWEGEVGLVAGALESPTSPQPSPPPGAEREFLGQRLRNLSRVTISAAGFSCGGFSGFDCTVGAGTLPPALGGAGGPANSSAKLSDGSAKLRVPGD